jgi:release factor glutamine methyltransferase
MPQLADRLAAAGFLSAREEAEELRAAAGGDGRLLEELAERRLAGEPLAWIVGGAGFCGLRVRVDPGVYVPRPHTERLALRAAERLPADGTAVDVCTGSGAVAALLADRRPAARVIATALRSRVDLVTAVAPYVPTGALASLQRDTFTHESALAYDGGPDGTAILRRVLEGSRGVLRPGGALLLELGGDQAGRLAGDLARLGFGGVVVLADEDGDARGVEATLRA